METLDRVKPEGPYSPLVWAESEKASGWLHADIAQGTVGIGSEIIGEHVTPNETVVLRSVLLGAITTEQTVQMRAIYGVRHGLNRIEIERTVDSLNERFNSFFTIVTYKYSGPGKSLKYWHLGVAEPGALTQQFYNNGEKDTGTRAKLESFAAKQILKELVESKTSKHDQHDPTLVGNGNHLAKAGQDGEPKKLKFRANEFKVLRDHNVAEIQEIALRKDTITKILATIFVESAGRQTFTIGLLERIIDEQYLIGDSRKIEAVEVAQALRALEATPAGRARLHRQEINTPQGRTYEYYWKLSYH